MLKRKFLVFFFFCYLLSSLSPVFCETAKGDDLYKPFDETVKDTEKTSGMFNLYQTKQGQVYLEIQPDQLDKPFLLTINLSKGIGQAGILSGMPLDNYVIQFHKVNDQIQVVQMNPYFKAKPGTPLQKSIPQDFSNSMMGTLKIVSIHPDTKSILADAGDFFLSDVGAVIKMVNQGLKGAYGINPAESSFTNLQSFPENTEIETELNLSSPTPPKDVFSVTALPDWRSFSLGVHYSISKLPEDHYVPRLSDDRVGYFVSSMKNFSSDDPASAVVRYINRWDVAKKPIVFWIENTTPVEYREAIRDGVLEWNKAFAAIGIPNAVEVKIQPDDAAWSVSDIRYNVIHWTTSSESSFAAEGPSRVNPFTGEIYNASVIIDGESIRDLRFIYHNELQLYNPNPMPANSLKASVCSLQSLKANEGEIGALTMALESPDPAHFETPDWFLHAYIKDLVMHEVGHCFGLRHNFHASALLSLKELGNPEITRKTGLSSSVMDYLPVNITPHGEYFSSTIGAYDYWAIAYGYTPFGAQKPRDEKTQLNRIAAQSYQKPYAYETDEDTVSPFRVDPFAAMFDLSDDPMAYAVTRFKLYDRLWQLIDEKLPFPGESFNQARQVFDLIFKAYGNVSDIPARFIGGDYFSRNHQGSPGGNPLKPVGKNTQLRALQILDHYVFSKDAFRFSPNLLNKLAGDRRSDHFSETQVFLTPMNYPINDQISEIQERVLDRLFQPVLLNRLLDNEHAVSKTSQTLTLHELFGWMSDHFWQELDSGELVETSRRSLQRDYLEHLAQLVVAPRPQMFGSSDLDLGPVPIAFISDDARNMAEYQLLEIRKKIQRALQNRRYSADMPTNAHLTACLRLINQALQAKLHQTLPGVGSGEGE